MLTRISRRRTRRFMTWLVLGSMSIPGMSGCSRQFWRKQADKDSYNAVAEKLNNPHWQVPRMELTPDPRSRFFDPYDPDKEPLPPDDPSAHELMHCVNGKKGYKGWHKFGTSFAIENPQWLQPYGIQMNGVDPVEGHSQVQLLEVNLPQAMDLASIHSREYQTAIEDLYLSALTLTAERFRLGVRYLGVSGTEPSLGFNTRTNSAGQASSNMGVAFGVSQLLPTGGQIAVDIANSVTWVFAGNGSHASAPSIGYSFTQPLLFRAGRKIVLEALTQTERNVLYAARVLARFRQTLFTQVTVNYLNLLQQRQSILNTMNNIRQLEEQLEAQQVRDTRVPGRVTALLEGMEGLVVPPSLQEKFTYDGEWLKWKGDMSDEEGEMLLGISDDPDFKAKAQELIDFKKQQVTSLSFLQLRDRLNQNQATLANSQRQLADQLDATKLILGLPPNINMQVDETLLKPFVLISWDLIDVETELRKLQKEIGAELLPDVEQGVMEVLPPGLDSTKKYVRALNRMRDKLYEVGIVQVKNDFLPIQQILELTKDDWKAAAPGIRYFRSEAERTRLVERMTNDLRQYRLAERDFALGSGILKMLEEVLAAESEEDLLRKLDKSGNGLIELAELPEGWVDLPRTGNRAAEESYSVAMLLVESVSGAREVRDKYLLRMAQSLEVIQAALRVEQIALVPFTLDGTMNVPDIEKVIAIGLENRHDLMNVRAQVMDARRRVEIAANALEAGLDITFRGTQGLNPDAESSTTHSAGVQFTTPMDQVLERNVYRQALVTYQRARRTYMDTEDRIKQSIRQSWRQIQVQEYRLEIDRTAVRNAALQYDSASLQAAGGQQQNALSLTQALDSVLRAQNTLVGDWVTYETNRLNIFRDMGIMEIDPRGVWTDPFYLQMDNLSVGGDVSSPASPPDAVLPVPEPQN
ncbi:MAG: TolC family protein [Planctomycetaceae bacterium]